MSYGLYNGSSEGFEMLSDGYIDYAKEVIAKRSIPDLRDGLKPVGRRILYSIRTTVKGDNLSKCGTLVGRVMELHPHGDSSVYGALCGMTDINGSLNVPLFIGQGEFGRVYSQDTPAAMRYTKAKLSPDANDYFRDMEACELIQSEEGEGVDVALKRDEVLDGGVHLVVGQESEGDGEEDEVAEYDAHHEHEVGGDDEWGRVAAFILVEARGDEAVELEDDVGCCHDDAYVKAGHHVYDKLAGELGVDELHLWR